MIIDICMVKATRSQKPDPNHCALCAGDAPAARVATKTIATAVSANANASGNHRSNQSDKRSPIRARPDSASGDSIVAIGGRIYQRGYTLLEMQNSKFKLQTLSEGRPHPRDHRVLALFAFCILNFALLLLPSAAAAQLAAAQEGPIVYGHHHVNATDPAAHKKFWADTLGGTVVKVGTDGREVVRMPNVWIFMREQAAKGGTKGSVHDHIGLSVPNLRPVLDKVKANGYRVVTAAEALPGQKVNGDVVEIGTGPVSALAYILGPDEVKVELVEVKA